MHGHIDHPDCPNLPEGANESTRNYLGKTLGDQLDQFRAQQRKIMEAFPQIEVIQIWECDWDRLKKTETKDLEGQEQDDAIQIQMFMMHYEDQRPCERLNAREALRGGNNLFFLHLQLLNITFCFYRTHRIVSLCTSRYPGKD